MASELDTYLTRRPKTDPRDLPAPFQARRMALLERHLGRSVNAPLAPIHCMGDSNTMFFAGSEYLRFIRYARLGFWRPRYINRGLDLLPCFRTFHTGPSTSWKAAEFGSTTRTREKIEWLLKKKIAPGSQILLSIGEIDCRNHMPRQALEGKSIHDMVHATAERLLRLPKRIREIGFDCAMWGIPQVLPFAENDPRSALPAVGPLELRMEITAASVAAMREQCAAAGIPYVALVNTLHGVKEPMGDHFFHDGIHLSQALMPHALRMLRDAGILRIP